MKGSVRFVPWVMMCVFLFVSGCETAKGFKKDVENTWENAKDLDEKFKENWW